MMAEPLAAALHGVAKHYHGFTLGPLNLEIPAGSIVGLIGENGAGKTTLLKLLTGVNRPDAGTVELLSATPDDAAVRAKIGVVFEDAYFYESLTPAQVGASLRGIFGPAWDAGYFAALLEQFHLPPKKSIKELSRGMRMKLNLASALAHRPGLLVLDEATSGLDPAARSEILDILLDFIQDERHSVLLSSHITTDLEQIADTIAYLHHGQLLFAKNKDDLMEEYGILRCSQQDLDRLPPEWIAATCRTAAGFAAVSETSPFAPASFSAGASSGVSVPAIFSISSRFLIITFLIPNALAISRNSARLFPSSAFRSCIVYFR